MPSASKSETLNSDNNAGNQKDTSSYYAHSDKGPFVVYIYPTNPGFREVAHPLQVCIVVSNIAYNDIYEVKKIGVGKVMAELKTASAANNLINSPLLASHKLRAFIPSYRVLRTGVIKDIPSSFDENYLNRSWIPL